MLFHQKKLLPSASCSRIDLAILCPPRSRLMTEPSVHNIPFELHMNLIFLQVHVNDSKVLWFDLDSGLETSILDSLQAEALGLTLVEKSQVPVPGGTIELAFAENVSLKLSGI